MQSYKKLTLHNRESMIRQELEVRNEDIPEEIRLVKFEKMSESPYAFFRGSNHLYWEDFFRDWRFSLFGGKSSTLTWINGDAHIYNYGAYSDHNGEANFCMDDFDDAIIADYQYDLWRMAISIVLDCRYQGRFEEKVQRKALQKFSRTYLKEMASVHEDDIQKEVHLNKDTAKGLLKKFLKKVMKKKNRIKMLDKWTLVEDGKRCFDFENEKLGKLTKREYNAICKAMEFYQETLSDAFTQWDADHFKIKDIAKRLWSGTGSLGSERYYILLEADDESPDDDIILDVKEQGKPPLYMHMNNEEQKEYDSIFDHEGKRHAEAFKALAEHPDKYLGWMTYNGKAFSVKERSPFKADFPTDKLKKPEELYFMAEMWAKILATRHERASHFLYEDPKELSRTFKAMTREKQKPFISFLSELAFRYADCVEQDYRIFLSMTTK